MTRVLIDLTGREFGRLTVLVRAVTNTSQGKPRWVCRCLCGSEAIVAGADLRSGHTKTCGCSWREHPGRTRNPMVTYIGAHTRVHRERGKAKYQACADCGGIAQEWSYDGTDPDEVTGPHVTGGGRDITATYSLKPEHYSPRCKPCHSRFDQKPALEGAS